MRASHLLTFLLLAALLAAPVALAAGGSHRDAAKARDAHEDHDEDERDHADKRGKSARGWMDENATANRTARIESFLTQMRAMHVSWKENATIVREACKDLRADEGDNTTRAEHHEIAHCIRDGYRAWRVAHHADMKELRDEFRTLMRDMRASHGKHADA